MDAFLVTTAVLSLACIIAVAMASGFLAQARAEFQGRLREIALRRAQFLLLAAVCVGGTAATVAAYAASEWRHVAGAPRTLQLKPALRLDPSNLGPHLREQEHVAD